MSSSSSSSTSAAQQAKKACSIRNVGVGLLLNLIAALLGTQLLLSIKVTPKQQPHPQLIHSEPAPVSTQTTSNSSSSSNDDTPEHTSKQSALAMLKRALPHQQEQELQQLQTPPQQEKFLTYGRFPGRLNNQIFNFVAALQHAVALNRTLIVPPENHLNRWTGWLDQDVLNFWDLSSLNAHYKIDWHTAAQQEVNVTSDCTLSPEEQKSLLIQQNTATRSTKWDSCPILQIGGHGGLLFCGQHHRFCGRPEHERIAFEIVPHLKVSPAFAQFLPNQTFFLGVHSRTIGGGPPFPTPHCMQQVRKVTNAYMAPDMQAIHNTNQTVSDYCALWNNLPSQLSPKYRALLNSSDTPFFLASDGSFDWSQAYSKEDYSMIDFQPMLKWIEASYDQAVANPDTISSTTTSPYLQNLLQPGKKRSFMKDVTKLSSALLDMYTLVQQEYFVSCPVSTVAVTVCLLRGLDKLYDSNCCWMLLHPDSKYAVFPEWLVHEGQQRQGTNQ